MFGQQKTLVKTSVFCFFHYFFRQSEIVIGESPNLNTKEKTMKFDFARMVVIPIILLILFAIAGQFVGSFVFAELAHLPDWQYNTFWQYKNSDWANYKGVHWRLNVAAAAMILTTLFPVIAGLIILIVGREKRELHGSSRFATKSEIAAKGLLSAPKSKIKQSRSEKKQELALIKQAKAENREYIKYPVYPDFPYIYIGGKVGNQYLKWYGNEFCYVAAPTRTGKGISIAIPNCLDFLGSLVVFDPKFENYKLTSHYRKTVLGQEVYLFNPAGTDWTVNPDDPDCEKKQKENTQVRSHRWNPFHYVSRNEMEMKDDLQVIAASMYTTKSNDSGNAQFWTSTSKSLFVGMAMYMLETENDRDETIDYSGNSSLSLLYKFFTPKNGLSLYDWINYCVLGKPVPDNVKIKGAGKRTIKDHKTDKEYELSEACRIELGKFANGDIETSNNIVTSVTAPLSEFLTAKVAATTDENDFDFRDLRKKPMTIYIGINPRDLVNQWRLINLFFSQLINENIRQLPDDNPALKYQTLLLLDEFTALGNIPVLEKGVAYIAGYNLRMLLIFQNPSQLESVYSKAAVSTFLSNFAVRVLFTAYEQQDAEAYAKIIGNETFQTKSLSRSFGKGGHRSENKSGQKREVMNADEIKRMSLDKCVISMATLYPIFCNKIRYYNEKKTFLPKVYNRHTGKNPPVEIPTHGIILASREVKKELPQQNAVGNGDLNLDEQPPIVDEYGEMAHFKEDNFMILDKDEITEVFDYSVEDEKQVADEMQFSNSNELTDYVFSILGMTSFMGDKGEQERMARQIFGKSGVSFLMQFFNKHYQNTADNPIFT